MRCGGRGAVVTRCIHGMSDGEADPVEHGKNVGHMPIALLGSLRTVAWYRWPLKQACWRLLCICFLLFMIGIYEIMIIGLGRAC